MGWDTYGRRLESLERARHQEINRRYWHDLSPARKALVIARQRRYRVDKRKQGLGDAQRTSQRWRDTHPGYDRYKRLMKRLALQLEALLIARSRELFGPQVFLGESSWDQAQRQFQLVRAMLVRPRGPMPRSVSPSLIKESAPLGNSPASWRP